MNQLYMLAGAALFAIGFFGIIGRTHLLKKILAVNIMGNGVFIVFIATAARTAGAVADPIPHAMVLTGIVVSVCATGLALALADRVHVAAGRPELVEESEP